MPLASFLGRVVNLEVDRLAPPGAYLALDRDDDEDPGILLPRGEVPEGTAPGARLDVFVYLDSDDRPIATMREPELILGEVAFLTVTDVTSFGAFCSWGLRKDLLVPRGEQTRDVLVGERHPIGLYVDDTERLAGTMRVTELLRDEPPFAHDEWVDGEAWRRDPDIGIFVILERRFVGLLPISEPNNLSRGDATRFRIASVLPDGKVELSLRDLAHREVLGDAQRILDKLRGSKGLEVGDRSPPEQIFSVFGLSKKAFKRAVGGLLKRGEVEIDARGFVVPKRSPPR